MILIDQITDHDGSNTGNNTVPPGVVGSLWCHLVSTESLEELQGFLALNFSTIGQSFENIRQPNINQPELGSLMTYAGLMPDQRDAAIDAGASPNRAPTVSGRAFDSLGFGSAYEP